MNTKRRTALTLAGLSCLALAMVGWTTTDERHDGFNGLVREVRLGTSDFRNVNAAVAAGYGSAGTCVSGPEVGAMGVHFPNGALVGDGLLEARRPEVMIYEQRNGRLRLVGVEFIVIAGDWDATHSGPPALLGQHFQYVGSPNRYGLPAFYELHVWAWRDNPNGMFVDWNPAVSCEEYAGDAPLQTAAGHGAH